MKLADGVMAKEVVKAINSFNYEAFNARQAALLTADAENRRKLQAKADKAKAARKRLAVKLNAEYEALMLEWTWGRNRRFSTTEALVDRLDEVERELAKLL